MKIEPLLRTIRQEPERYQNGARSKGITIDIEEILRCDKAYRETKADLDHLRAEKKILTQNLQATPKHSSQKDVQKKTKDSARSLKEKERKYEQKLENLRINLEQLVLHVPNPPRPDVQVGKDESKNKVVKIVGTPRTFDFHVQDHLEIGERLELIDMERAAKIAGSRFGSLKNEAVLLEFALVQFALDLLGKEGFRPILPPSMINEEAMRDMGYLEHGGKEETYFLEKDNLYLIGTSEQAIGPFFKDEILHQQNLPLRWVGFSPCFRREAGSYGKDTRGIFRLHLFDKVEMFSLTTPDASDREHQFLLALEERIVQALEIPYRVIEMCSGDLGVPAARKYDIECWIPSQGRYRETHSTSNCTDFQSLRLNIRYRTSRNERTYVHTLNGTAIAIGRMLIAILENYQQKDGSVVIPECLWDYLHGKKEIRR